MNDEWDASNMKLLNSSHIEVVPDAAPGILKRAFQGLQWLVCRHKIVSWCNKNPIQVG